MSQLTLYGVVGHTLKSLGDVGKVTGFLALIEQVEERPRLNGVIIAFAVIVSIGITGYLQWRLGKYSASTDQKNRAFTEAAPSIAS